MTVIVAQFIYLFCEIQRNEYRRYFSSPISYIFYIFAFIVEREIRELVIGCYKFVTDGMTCKNTKIMKVSYKKRIIYTLESHISRKKKLNEGMLTMMKKKMKINTSRKY